MSSETRPAPKPTPRQRARTFLAYGADLGAGPVCAWITIDRFGVTIRQYRKQRRLKVPLADAVTLLARRAQMRVVRRRP